MTTSRKAKDVLGVIVENNNIKFGKLEGIKAIEAAVDVAYKKTDSAREKTQIAHAALALANALEHNDKLNAINLINPGATFKKQDLNNITPEDALRDKANVATAIHETPATTNRRAVDVLGLRVEKDVLLYPSHQGNDYEGIQAIQVARKLSLDTATPQEKEEIEASVKALTDAVDNNLSRQISDQHGFNSNLKKIDYNDVTIKSVVPVQANTQAEDKIPKRPTRPAPQRTNLASSVKPAAEAAKRSQPSATTLIAKKLNPSAAYDRAKEFAAKNLKELKQSASTKADAAVDKLKEAKDKVLKSTETPRESVSRKLAETRESIRKKVRELKGETPKDRGPKV